MRLGRIWRVLQIEEEYDNILSKFGQQQLIVVNYACGFNQSETGNIIE